MEPLRGAGLPRPRLWLRARRPVASDEAITPDHWHHSGHPPAELTLRIARQLVLDYCVCADSPIPKVIEQQFAAIEAMPGRHLTAGLNREYPLGSGRVPAPHDLGKRRLREIDSRVRFLNKRLDELQVVDRPPDDTDKVFFGAHVVLEAEDGTEQRWRIVGPDEFDVGQGKLSMDSPMARALLGKKLDDEISVRSPSGEQYYVITDIRYGSAES